jgi:hypothetical protein
MDERQLTTKCYIDSVKAAVIVYEPYSKYSGVIDF